MSKLVDAQVPILSLQKALMPEEYDANKLFDAIQTLTVELKRMQLLHSVAINFNAVHEYTQAGQPTLESGELAIWNDSDASSGQPTHYLMFNLGGTIVTFASEETV